MNSYVLKPSKEKMEVGTTKYTYFDIIDTQTDKVVCNYDVLQFENITRKYQVSIDYTLYKGQWLVRIFGDIEFDFMGVTLKGVDYEKI